MAETKHTPVRGFARVNRLHALAADHALLLRLVCEGKIDWIRRLGAWGLLVNGKCYDSTLDEHGCPRLTDELRKAIKEAGL